MLGTVTTCRFTNEMCSLVCREPVLVTLTSISCKPGSPLVGHESLGNVSCTLDVVTGRAVGSGAFWYETFVTSAVKLRGRSV